MAELAGGKAQSGIIENNHIADNYWKWFDMMSWFELSIKRYVSIEREENSTQTIKNDLTSTHGLQLKDPYQTWRSFGWVKTNKTSTVKIQCILYLCQ